MSKPILIDDPWVLSRSGRFSKSFSSFLSKMIPTMPENKQNEVAARLEQAREKMTNVDRLMELQRLKLEKLDKLAAPSWVKPLVSKILEDVQKQVASGLERLADELFGAGIFSLSEALYDVAKERGITNEGVLHLVKALPEFEALLYSLNVRKFYRDHCAHQLRVAALGDFLLDSTSEIGDVEGVIRDKLGFSPKDARTAWWFAGLLHDTGIPLAKLSTAVNWSLINEILRCYPLLDIQAHPIFLSLAGGLSQNQQYLSFLLGDMPKSWRRMIMENLGEEKYVDKPILFRGGNLHPREYQFQDPHIDHGVAGAINLLSTLGPPEKLRRNLPEDRPLVEAAKAICLHNFKNKLKSVLFEDFPLAFLLIFADELQEWSRPVPIPLRDTYFTTSLQKVALVESISYEKNPTTWDIPYTNIHAKKLARFDFRKLCRDKENHLKVLDCTHEFPESEVQLRDVKEGEIQRENSFTIQIVSR
jgi:hypothetical protein